MYKAQAEAAGADQAAQSQTTDAQPDSTGGDDVQDVDFEEVK